MSMREARTAEQVNEALREAFEDYLAPPLITALKQLASIAPSLPPDEREPIAAMIPVLFCNKVMESLGVGDERCKQDAAELVRCYVAAADVVGWNWLGERGSIASLVAAAALASKAPDVETLLFDKFVSDDCEDAQLAFNIASLHARAGRTAELYPAVRRAIQLGKEPDEFMRDDDFTAIHADPGFVDALRG